MAAKHTYDEFIKKVKGKERGFLHAVGHLAVNQSVNISHVDTGLSRNAKHYVLTDGYSSKFGNLPGEDGKVRQPPESVKGTPPRMPATVKIVAPLDYDIFLERRFGTLKRSIDLIRSPIKILAKRMLKI